MTNQEDIVPAIYELCRMKSRNKCDGMSMDNNSDTLV